MPRPLGRRRSLVAGAAALALLAGCSAEPEMPRRSATYTPETAASAPPVPAAELAPTGDPVQLAGDLTAPWSIAFAGDAVLLSSRDSGEILELVGDGTRVVGTVEGVVSRGESGLLGIAAQDQSFVYAYSTGADGNRIQRFPLRVDNGARVLGEPETILDGIPENSTHDGGRIAFGPDGMLYATTGDAQDRPAAQNPESLAGKILRMTPDGDVPADNPIPGSLVYSLGHRNPQGIAWAEDGRMFAAEFGQDTWDELNIITAGGNYGWPEVEGIAGDPAYIDPVQQWNPDQASPSGIAVVGGTIFVANLRGRMLRSIPVADPTTSTELFVGEYGRLRDVVASPDGGVWMLTNNTDGRGQPAPGDDRLLAVPLG
ncbi:PQQ-dependent sugar dehydrogenase [Microbacterium sp. NPDC091313]